MSMRIFFRAGNGPTASASRVSRLAGFRKYLFASEFERYRKNVEGEVRRMLHELGGAITGIYNYALFEEPSLSIFVQPTYELLIQGHEQLKHMRDELERTNGRVTFFRKLYEIKEKVSELQEATRGLKQSVLLLEGFHKGDEHFVNMVDGINTTKLVLSWLMSVINQQYKGLGIRSIKLTELVGWTCNYFGYSELPRRIREDIVVDVDRYLFGQVIHNLVKNAREAGATEVRIDAGPIDDTRFGIAVIDNGSGIETSLLGHIWSSFSTKLADGNGNTGAGLVFCRNTIARHGGHIFVAETSDRGTKFQIVLPIHQDQGYDTLVEFPAYRQ